jgi:Flp pilus assembly protein TadB
MNIMHLRVMLINKRQNRRLDIIDSTLSQLNELTISVQNLATSMKHMLDIQTEQNKRLEELENRDGEKWRSISMYVLTALIGAVIGFVLKQVGI